MKYYLPVLLSLSILSGCNSLQEPSSEKPPAEINAHYQFTSVGYAPIEIQSGDSFDVKVLNAIKASKLEAYKEMAEQIYGVLLSAKSDVEGAALGDDKIKAQVRGLVKGARVLQSYHEGDMYITELAIDMQTLPFLKSATFNNQGVPLKKVQQSVYY